MSPLRKIKDHPAVIFVIENPTYNQLKEAIYKEPAVASRLRTVPKDLEEYVADNYPFAILGFKSPMKSSVEKYNEWIRNLGALESDYKVPEHIIPTEGEFDESVDDWIANIPRFKDQYHLEINSRVKFFD